MVRLKAQWSDLRSKHYNTMPGDPKWKAAFDRVGKAIAKSDELVMAADLPGAHEALEEIRETLLETRRRNGIDYYLDYLTEFHTTMEEVVTAVNVGDPGRLSQETISQLRGLVAKAVDEWSRVRAAPFDRARFGFDEKKLARMQDLLETEAQALDRLRKALPTGSNPEIVASGKAIKPIFAQSFMIFGDFPEPLGPTRKGLAESLKR